MVEVKADALEQSFETLELEDGLSLREELDLLKMQLICRASRGPGCGEPRL
jgi:hypothetical protein